MSDASYYAGIIGLHRIRIVAQKPRFFYTRQAAFHIDARILDVGGDINYIMVAEKGQPSAAKKAACRARGRRHFVLPPMLNAACRV